jgi:hypothetical protein
VLIRCPKCGCSLQVPDGATAAFRCPKCQTVFSPPAPDPEPQFEVVEDSPAPPAKKPVVARADDEDDDRSRRRRRRDDDDDDDDYDDRPRSRRRDRDDYDDEDDDRPRRRRRRDDEDDRPRKKKRRPAYDESGGDRRAAFGRAKLGALLLMISLWLYVGALGIMTLFMIIGWAGGRISDGLLVLPGLVGMGNWIVAGVGLGFAIAGPAKARGLAIAAASVALVHLILAFVTAGQGGLSIGGTYVRGFGPSFNWSALATELPMLDGSLSLLVYSSRAFGHAILPILTGACELARFILICLLLKSLAEAAGDPDAGMKCRMGVVAGSIITGVAILLNLLMALIFDASKPDLRTWVNIGSAVALLTYLAHAFMVAMPAIGANETKDALARRS